MTNLLELSLQEQLQRHLHRQNRHHHASSYLFYPSIRWWKSTFLVRMVRMMAGRVSTRSYADVTMIVVCLLLIILTLASGDSHRKISDSNLLLPWTKGGYKASKVVQAHPGCFTWVSLDSSHAGNDDQASNLYLPLSFVFHLFNCSFLIPFSPRCPPHTLRYRLIPLQSLLIHTKVPLQVEDVPPRHSLQAQALDRSVERQW